MPATYSADEVAILVADSDAKDKRIAELERKRAREPVVLKAEPATPRNAGPDVPFRNAREYLTLVMKAFMERGRPFDERLIPYYESNISAIADGEGGRVKKAVGSDEQSGVNDAYGGFLIPTTFSPNLLKIDPEDDPMGGKTTLIPMSSPHIKMPARVDKNHTTSVSGGLTLTRRPQTVATSPSRMELEQVDLRATTLMGLSYSSEELLVDSPISIAALLSAGFSDQFTYHMIGERISGTGVGEYEGVLNCPALVTVDAEAGQAADTFEFANIVKMRSRCWRYDKAIWIANHDCYPQLSQLKLVVGTGGQAMYTPSLREDRPDLLNGRPIIYSEYASTVGNVGDLILGNWAEYLEGMYQAMQSEESIHVRFTNHERAFKFWTRNDGRCWWRSALTPKNSTQTLSPFIVLAAR